MASGGMDRRIDSGQEYRKIESTRKHTPVLHTVPLFDDNGDLNLTFRAGHHYAARTGRVETLSDGFGDRFLPAGLVALPSHGFEADAGNVGTQSGG